MILQEGVCRLRYIFRGLEIRFQRRCWLLVRVLRVLGRDEFSWSGGGFVVWRRYAVGDDVCATARFSGGVMPRPGHQKHPMSQQFE